MRPLQEYGVIGDCHTAALVSTRGEIDWWCAPRFDSPPVLDALLGGERRIATSSAGPAARFEYEDGTNVLHAQWPDAEAWYFMPYPRGRASEIVCLRRAGEAHSALRIRGNGIAREADVAPAQAELDATRAAWRAWLGDEPLPADVARSLLALKLMMYEPTGAIVAAPTSSLPETLGGERNWDYRYAWIRDTAFCAEAFSRWGKHAEVECIAYWLLEHVPLEQPLRVLYRVDGRVAPDEREVPLPGYAGSRPVREGNGAIRQEQLDAYGHVIETIHVCDVVDAPLVEAAWPQIVRLVEEVIERWREPDNGIWEVPEGRHHFTYSKAMAWYAIEEAIAIAEHHHVDAPLDRWRRERDAIREEVLARGVDPERRAFRQAYDIAAPDSSTLRIGGLGLVPPDGDLAKATVRWVATGLDDHGLLRRYDTPDGLPGREGAFLACTFWLAQALHEAGDAEAARAAFERAQAQATPLGLYSEEADAAAGILLGNFPQALSHAAHLTAAATLAGRPRQTEEAEQG